MILVYLTAKETHIFNIHLIPEALIKFYPKWYEHVWTDSYVRLQTILFVITQLFIMFC